MARIVDRIAAYQVVLVSIAVVIVGVAIISSGEGYVTDHTAKAILLSVGASIIAVGMVSFVTDFALRKGLVDMVASRMEVRRELLDSGITAIGPRRVDVDLAGLIENSHEEVFIHGMTARSVIMNVYTALQGAAERGVRIEILIASEDSPGTKLRELEEKGENIFRTEVDDVIRKGAHLLDGAKKVKTRAKIEIKTHGRLPTCSLYVIDDVILYTPYFFLMTGPESPVIKLDANARWSALVSALLLHRRKLWKDATLRFSTKQSALNTIAEGGASKLQNLQNTKKT